MKDIPASILEQIKDSRRQTLATVDALVKKARDCELPAPPAALEATRLKLLNNTYQVMVAGEKKRGKSSFINALIGRTLLPTNVDIATCEVFRVRRALQEGYRLRFEDGTSREIAASELEKYGSQVRQDSEGTPQLHDIIRWVEVDLPTADFLPVGLSLLDTPGLGSLYASHGQITQRFVPQSDAVIFVLDAEKPILEEELDFVGKILNATSNIFFVLTKIDLFDDEHWQDIQKRDIALLEQRFKAQLPDLCIWPISSLNLQQAADTHDDLLLEVSYYQQLSRALQAFLFRVAGWDRCVQVLSVANHYHSEAEKILSNRLASLRAESTQQRVGLQQDAAKRLQNFGEDWGVNGKQSRELTANLQKTATGYRRNFISTLEINGTLESTYRQKIDGLKTVEEAHRLSQSIDDSIVTEVLKAWHDTCNQAYNACAALLTPFIKATDALLPQVDVDDPNLQTTRKFEDFKSNPLGQLQEADKGLRSGIGVSAGIILTAGKIIGPLFPHAVLPLYLIGIPAVLVMGAWSAKRGWKGVKEKQLQEARAELHNHLSGLLAEIRTRFFQAELVAGESVVNQYFTLLVDTMTKQIQEIAAVKLEQAKEESDRLNKQTQFDKQQRQARAEQVQQQLTDWSAIGQSILTSAADLKTLDQLL